MREVPSPSGHCKNVAVNGARYGASWYRTLENCRALHDARDEINRRIHQGVRTRDTLEKQPIKNRRRVNYPLRDGRLRGIYIYIYIMRNGLRRSDTENTG